VPEKPISGVYAAMLTPRDANGIFNPDAIRRCTGFLLREGVARFAINGATGEFCLTKPKELEEVLAVLKETCGDRAEFLVGIGAAGTRDAVRLGEIAIRAGAKGLLLPMPYFFPYSQDDLQAFSAAVARELPLPILLYNLPQFTSGLAPKTVLKLTREIPNIVGVKDSSGSLDTLRLLTSEHPETCRMVGNDAVIAAALRENVCDGVISGVACVLPELIRSLYETGIANIASQQFEESIARLNDFITRINALPTPWGLKIVAEARNLVDAHFGQPLATTRVEQKRELQAWFRSWVEHTLVA